MSTKHETWGMSFSPRFRELSHAAALRAVGDRGNPQREQHAARRGPPKIYSDHAAEAVVMAVTALEAGINEIATWARFGFVTVTTPLPDEFMRSNVADKWNIVPNSLVGRSFDCGAAPYQDFAMLIALRDEVIHFKWQRDQVPRFMRSLQARDLTLPDDVPGIYWIEAALTDRVAEWAIATMNAMFAKLTEITGLADSPTWVWH